MTSAQDSESVEPTHRFQATSTHVGAARNPFSPFGFMLSGVAKRETPLFFSGLVFARNGNPDAKSLALFQIEIKHISLTLFFRISLGQFFHGTEWTAEFDLMGDNAVSPAKSLTPSAETAISVQTERKRLYMAHQPILVHKPPLPVIEKSGALFAIVPKPIDGRMLRCSRFGADVGIFFWGTSLCLSGIYPFSQRIQNPKLRHGILSAACGWRSCGSGTCGSPGTHPAPAPNRTIRR